LIPPKNQNPLMNLTKRTRSPSRQSRPDFAGLVARIFREFRREDGGVNWNLAFSTHPEWRKALQWSNKQAQQSAYQLASLFKHKPERLAQALQGAESEPALVSSNGGGEPGLPPGADRRSIVETIIKQYGHLEKIPYAEIWKAHPDWQKTLNATTPAAMRPLYAEIARVAYQRGIRNPKFKQRKYAPRHEAPAPAPAPAPEPPPVLRFCPHCGTNLQLFHTALAIARKHTKPTP